MDNVDRDIDIYKSLLERTPEGFVDVGGKRFGTDYYALIERVVLIGSEMGMGGCKSITEFKDMIDEEDPTLIDAVIFAIMCNNRRKWADPKKDRSVFENSPEIVEQAEEHRVAETQVAQISKETLKDPRCNLNFKRKGKYRRDIDEHDMSSFVLMHNVDREAVIEAKKKFQSGQIKEVDFSHIDAHSLANMSEEEFEKTLQQMNEYVKQTTTFKLDMNKFAPFR